MKKILILIGILVMGMAATVYGATMDAPHNVTNNIVCADCHDFGNPPAEAACLSCHINDTGGGYSKTNAPKVLTHSSANTSSTYGTWTFECRNCHKPHDVYIGQRISFPGLIYIVKGTLTSITENTVAGTSTFGYSGIVVTNPLWNDFTKWGAKSGNERGLILIPDITKAGTSFEVVSATASAVTVKGLVSSFSAGSVTVGKTFALIYGQNINRSGAHLFDQTGPTSFAHNDFAGGDKDGDGSLDDSSPNGICQVCHTLTQHWRSNGTKAAIGVHAGQNGVYCMQCHPHEEGFKAAGCDTCHGFPPIVGNPPGPLGGPNGLVSTPAPTGSTIAGAHNTHFNTLGIDCAECHFNSKGGGPTHNDGTIQAITMGFSIFGGAIQGGSYDGQTAADYNTTVTSPVTTVSNTGTRECSNIYCHSTGQAAGGAPLTLGSTDYKKPLWSGAVQCGECHLADGVQGNASLMISGSHGPHVDAFLWKDCSYCHNGFGSGSPQHVNNEINMAFSADPYGNTPSFSQNPNTPGNGYGTCSTVYCHSIVQRDGGTALVQGTADYKDVTWGAAGSAACGTCHLDSNMATGSHTAHLAIVPALGCSACHKDAGALTNKHADFNIDVKFDPAYGATASYSQNPNPPGNNYGTCSTTLCHGTLSPAWGTNFAGIDQCTKCHGTPTASPAPEYAKAPPIDLAGDSLNTDQQVGAHQAHLNALSPISSKVTCSQCHIVPATANAAGHFDTTLPAEITFGVLASKNTAPIYNFGTGQCSSTYCHGNAMPRGTTEGLNKTPTWNDANYLTGNAGTDCKQCHGYPPLAIPAHIGNESPATCTICHEHVNALGNGFDDPSLHINGVLDGGGDNCTDCHNNANLSAGHLKHTDPNTVLAGKALSAGDYGHVSWWYQYSNTGGVPQAACGYCHPNTQSTHMNGTKNLNFDPAEAGLPAGTLKGKNGSPAVFTQNSGVSVTCSSVYCHSTGYINGGAYGYQTSPDWYGGIFAGDKCANCHGNSPNSGGKPGSLSHYNTDSYGMGIVGGHFVGIHYDNVYTGTTGLIQDINGNQNAHGDAATSTTISCQVCHNATVTTKVNDKNSICMTCHGIGAIALQGNMVIAAASTTHVDGKPDVVFMPGKVRSKAQVRDSITSVPELNDNWVRMNGYKQPTSHDESVLALNAAAQYNMGSKTCSSVACHNGNPVQWGVANITCNSCHTDLP